MRAIRFLLAFFLTLTLPLFSSHHIPRTYDCYSVLENITGLKRTSPQSQGLYKFIDRIEEIPTDLSIIEEFIDSEKW